jgi:hypothetical protein
VSWVYGKNVTTKRLQILQQRASHAVRFFARANQRNRLRANIVLSIGRRSDTIVLAEVLALALAAFMIQVVLSI